MISIEINPPHGGSISEIINDFKLSGIENDLFVVTDNPLSKLRMDSVMASIRIQEVFKKPTFATMSMRDKNKLGLQSSLLGANEFDITHILALTGDKARANEEKGVLEGDSNLLLSIIDKLNNGTNYCGRELNPKINEITAYSVLPSIYSKNTIKKMEKKLKFGAKGFFTQPFFDITELELFINDFNSLINGNEQLFIGFFPFISAKTVNYINDNIPGINVPKEIIDEMDLAYINNTEYEVGLKLSKEIYQKIITIHNNIHIMSNNNFELIQKIIK